MEENHERLRGKPADWINKVKEDIFPDDEGFEHITAKKVRDKYTNMKKAWKDAKTIQEQSGFGLREEDCERSIFLMVFKFVGQGSSPSQLAPQLL